MITSRTVAGAVAGAALIGLSLTTGGVASAHESAGHGAAGPGSPSCDTTGSATDSPGVQSGNVVQIPVLNCSEVNAAPSISIPPVFGPVPTP